MWPQDDTQLAFPAQEVNSRAGPICDVFSAPDGQWLSHDGERTKEDQTLISLCGFLSLDALPCCRGSYAVSQTACGATDLGLIRNAFQCLQGSRKAFRYGEGYGGVL